MKKLSEIEWYLLNALFSGIMVMIILGLLNSVTSQLQPQAMLAAVTSQEAPIAQHPASESFKQTGTAVPLEEDERALILNATIDHRKTAMFILDTGATYTSISEEMASDLGYDLRHVPKVTITTANGQVSLPKIKLSALTLNGYTIHDVEATVMPMPKNVPFSGLLGLSFVKRYKITIDSEASQLYIQPTAGEISSLTE
jgi:clan AA aspartic protease (TIGR02281 family)